MGYLASGYSQQAAELLPQIRDAGYPLAVSNFFGQSGGKFILDGILQYPVINHTYGSDGLIQHAPDFKADVIFTLQDIWVLNPVDLEQVRKWIPIVPIDHDPVSQPVLQNLKYAYKIITYAKYGQKQLQDRGIFSTYIPHTVNTDIFTPMDHKKRKANVGLPDNCFLVGMVAANKDNPPRKSFQEALDAFNMFLKDVPNALFYIHTNPEFPGGFNMKQYAEFLGIANKLLFPDVYAMNFNTSKEQMNLIYNTFDLLLMPSVSEGFGIPAIEAQACGVPVVVNNFTSMPELVKNGETGYVCDLISGPNGKRFTQQGSYFGIPDTRSIYDCMMRIYKKGSEKMGISGRKWVVENYDTKTVFKNMWLPYLQTLENDIYPVDKATPLSP